MISESKLNTSFPKIDILIEGYTEPYRFDRNCNGRGILLYIRKDIPLNEIYNGRLSGPSERLLTEIKYKKRKWVICCS